MNLWPKKSHNTQDLLQRAYDEAYQSSLHSILLETQNQNEAALMSWNSTLYGISKNLIGLNSVPLKTSADKSVMSNILEIERQCHDRIGFLESRNQPSSNPYLNSNYSSTSSIPQPRSLDPRANVPYRSDSSLPPKPNNHFAIHDDSSASHRRSNSSVDPSTGTSGNHPFLSDTSLHSRKQPARPSADFQRDISRTPSYAPPPPPPVAPAAPAAPTPVTTAPAPPPHREPRLYERPRSPSPPKRSMLMTLRSGKGAKKVEQKVAANKAASLAWGNNASNSKPARPNMALAGASYSTNSIPTTSNSTSLSSYTSSISNNGLDKLSIRDSRGSKGSITPPTRKPIAAPRHHSTGNALLAPTPSKPLAKTKPRNATQPPSRKGSAPLLDESNTFLDFDSQSDAAKPSSSAAPKPGPRRVTPTVSNTTKIVVTKRVGSTTPSNGSKPVAKSSGTNPASKTVQKPSTTAKPPALRPKPVTLKSSPVSAVATSHSKSVGSSPVGRDDNEDSDSGGSEPNLDDWDHKAEKVLENLRGVDPDAARQILNEIVVKGDEVHWEDIAGLEEAKRTLRETVVYPFLRPDLFRGLREPARGLLLFGPPGTGKTMLARAVATESKSTFFSISASSLTSKFLGESEKLVRALFHMAKEMSPSVIFVDEIDSLLASRNESGEHEASRRIKNEFLVQWSDLQHAAAGREHKDGQQVLVLAATNLPWSIDEAARRRFVRRQYIPLPERETRKVQLLKLLQSQNSSVDEEGLEKLLDLTEDFSGSDITALAKDAAMGPLRSLGEALLTTATEHIRPIGFEDFKSSLKTIRPSVSKDGLKAFEEWAALYGSSGA